MSDFSERLKEAWSVTFGLKAGISTLQSKNAFLSGQIDSLIEENKQLREQAQRDAETLRQVREDLRTMLNLEPELDSAVNVPGGDLLERKYTVNRFDYPEWYCARDRLRAFEGGE